MLRRLQQAIWIALFACLVAAYGLAMWSASRQTTPYDHEQPTKSDEQAKGPNNEGKWWDIFAKHPTEWLLTLFNLFLVIYTRRLFVATAGLRDSTTRLWEASREQAEQTRTSIDLARADLVSTHRPILVVRHLAVNDPADDEPVEIAFQVSNVGGTAAEITEMNATPYFSPDELPGIPPYEIKSTIRPNRKILPGAVMPMNLISDLYNGVTLRMQLSDRSIRFYVFGYVLFNDDIGVQRRMAFCREFNRGTKRFSSVPDSDYEYPC